ncbi:SCO family protein [Oceanospirillum beijerinckii]|uniref:SCO family protein n=1 Tax=Oceanospirillum beijerinckii TaxID=64976 RepID=UPI00040D2570|nr:SCO family protein [Oceanospirillum beijerinckii]
MDSFKKHFLKALVMLIPAVALVAGMEYYQKQQMEQGQTSAQIGGTFVLQSADGPFDLSQQGDKLNVIYFGYTQCPDICPTSLSVMAHAFKQLPEEAMSRLQGILISVDPERDTLEHLKNYTEFFHSNIVGLTDTPENIKALAARYGAFYRKAEIAGSAMGYAVDHTSIFYLTNSQGQVVETVSHSASPDDLLAALKRQLKL